MKKAKTRKYRSLLGKSKKDQSSGEDSDIGTKPSYKRNVKHRRSRTLSHRNSSSSKILKEIDELSDDECDKNQMLKFKSEHYAFKLKSKKRPKTRIILPSSFFVHKTRPRTKVLKRQSDKSIPKKNRAPTNYMVLTQKYVKSNTADRIIDTDKQININTSHSIQI